VALVQCTFTHKQYTEHQNETDYPERNINNNKNTLEIIIIIIIIIVIQPLDQFGRNHSPVRRPVWLWYAASWASSEK